MRTIVRLRSNLEVELGTRTLFLFNVVADLTTRAATIELTLSKVPAWWSTIYQILQSCQSQGEVNYFVGSDIPS